MHQLKSMPAHYNRFQMSKSKFGVASYNLELYSLNLPGTSQGPHSTPSDSPSSCRCSRQKSRMYSCIGV